MTRSKCKKTTQAFCKCCGRSEMVTWGDKPIKFTCWQCWEESQVGDYAHLAIVQSEIERQRREHINKKARLNH